MSPTITIAALTIREALRRRLVAAFALITTALVSLSAWGFDRLAHTLLEHETLNQSQIEQITGRGQAAVKRAPTPTKHSVEAPQ